METIKKLVLGTSNSFESLYAAFLRSHKLELGLLASFIVLGSFLISFQPQLISMSDLAVIKTFKDIQLARPANPEKIDLKKIVASSMSYSYENTELGFYLKDLEFFDTYTKAKAEQVILASLPLSLRNKAKDYVRAVLILAEKHQVDPIWVLSVMWTESHFDYSARSWAGARGLMQIMPETRKFVYKQYKRRGNRLMVEGKKFKVNRFFPYPVSESEKTAHIRKLVNIELGIIYLKSLLKTFKSHKHATVAYNMGPGWTLMRLRKNLPVGEKNLYLDKVQSAYKRIVQKI